MAAISSHDTFITKPFCCMHRYLGQLLLIFISSLAYGQQQELSSGWKCFRASVVNQPGERVSLPFFKIEGWMDARVPGTVLAAQLQNGQIPDPAYGLNNQSIPDIYTTGRDYYTYWFVKDFTEKRTTADERILLHLRGVNYSYDVYLNGTKVNKERAYGMFLRRTFDITNLLSADGRNRLAVIVFPPDSVGNPNGGQGGDGTIAHGVTNQFVAGWDWIQPIRDRNTGIWDKVFIEHTGPVAVSNACITTQVPGKRVNYGRQEPATVNVSTELTNRTTATITGTLLCEVEGRKQEMPATVAANTTITVALPAMVISNPRLWWPNGYGNPNLYKMTVRFIPKDGGTPSTATQPFGIREITGIWNSHTSSREINVNGQRVFVKGANWIMADAMLRNSSDRYDAEVRLHQGMNINMIRVWGGGITERPEFYDACDKYGIMVMQDLWITGDCNGRWYDPFKKDDTTTRRKYPDDHGLFIRSAEDNVKMLRNHPSLAIWCGGNEIKPPADILAALRDTLLPALDGERIFFASSNDDSMSLDSHDGPYTIQTSKFFWQHRSYPFNSEIGSVGVGDYESLKRFIPASHMVPPYYDIVAKKWIADTVWKYHKYCSYDSSIEAYGHPRDVEDFARKAQLVNYDQYRSLMESFKAHMWDWYTGVMVWKTQNPWTAMVGQMYDVYLDANAGMYGLRTANKTLHAMYDPVTGNVIVSNEESEMHSKLNVIATAYTNTGNAIPIFKQAISLEPGSVQVVKTVKQVIDSLATQEGVFLQLSLAEGKNVLDGNFYWLPDAKGQYSGLQRMAAAKPHIEAKLLKGGQAAINVYCPVGSPICFFTRASVVDATTRERILPAFATENYCTVLPGETVSLTITINEKEGTRPLAICIEGWNTAKHYIPLKK